MGDGHNAVPLFLFGKIGKMCLFGDQDVGSEFRWADVNSVHRSRNGIYQRNGKLISLLTDMGKINPCYPDFEGETPDTVFYTGSGRRGDQKLDAFNRSMVDATRTREPVPLFCKLAVNRWKFLGNWRVVDSEYVYDGSRKRNVWRFVLKRARAAE